MSSAWERLSAWFSELEPGQPLVVAASGGVDSTLVAVAAKRLTQGPEPMRTLTVDSPFLPVWEKDLLAPLFQALGLEHGFLRLDLLAIEAVAANGPDRCYHCKRAVMGALLHAAGPGSLLLDGSNANDDPSRPGLRALEERGVRSPLREAGIAKADVRVLARELGLPNADKPSESCLATRISGPLTWEGLNIVENLEKHVRSLGIRDCRVRHDDLTITIETSNDEKRLLDENQVGITTAINHLGIPGYRWRLR